MTLIAIHTSDVHLIIINEKFFHQYPTTYIIHELYTVLVKFNSILQFDAF